MTDFSALFRKYAYNITGGSLVLTTILNNYIHIVVREIYCGGGDVLKFSGANVVCNILANGDWLRSIVRHNRLSLSPSSK